MQNLCKAIACGAGSTKHTSPKEVFLQVVACLLENQKLHTVRDAPIPQPGEVYAGRSGLAGLPTDEVISSQQLHQSSRWVEDLKLSGSPSTIHNESGRCEDRIRTNDQASRIARHRS